MSQVSHSLSRIPAAMFFGLFIFGGGDVHARHPNPAPRVPEEEVRRTFIDQHWAIYAPTAEQVNFDLFTDGFGRVSRIGLFIRARWSIDPEGEICLMAEAGLNITPGARFCHVFFREGDGYLVSVDGHTPAPVFFRDPETRMYVDSTKPAGD